MYFAPNITSCYIDSCAFDPKYSPEHEASIELFGLYEKEELILEITHSTKKEIEHPNTPAWVKEKSSHMVFTEEVALTPNEMARLRKIESILAGNGKVENIKQDARHIFEAQKYGSNFITTDGRILGRAMLLNQTWDDILIFKPTEFLALVKKYKNN